MDNDRTPDLSSMLNGLLQNPAVLAQLQGAIAAAGASGEQSPDAQTERTDDRSAPPTDADPQPAIPAGLSDLLGNGALMAQLPSMLGMLSSLSGKGGTPTRSSGRSGDHRIALLLALKPYLSEGRCEMIDSIVNLSRLGDLLGKQSDR